MEGLYAKYHITKNGTDEEVKDAFVLRPDRDKDARHALRVYAANVRSENPQLAQELIAWMDELDKSDEAGVELTDIEHEVLECLNSQYPKMLSPTQIWFATDIEETSAVRDAVIALKEMGLVDASYSLEQGANVYGSNANGRAFANKESA